MAQVVTCHAIGSMAFGNVAIAIDKDLFQVFGIVCQDEMNENSQ